jgi:hypothetical protein
LRIQDSNAASVRKVLIFPDSGTSEAMSRLRIAPGASGFHMLRDVFVPHDARCRQSRARMSFLSVLTPD